MEEYEPTAGLARYVECLWSIQFEPGDRHTVLPDGCMDLVLREGKDLSLLWIGPMTRARIVAVKEPTRFLGVRFRPGATPPFLRHSARSFLDRSISVRDTSLYTALARARSERTRRDLLLAVVARRFRPEPDPVVASAAAAILGAGGAVRIDNLAQRVGLSERQLHRRFVAGVGHGPKLLCRVARLQVARALAERGLCGAPLAAEAGYFDQAHLCRDLASFGLSPAALGQRPRPIPTRQVPDEIS
jgi:AraC-like DNA-binding protein